MVTTRLDNGLDLALLPDDGADVAAVYAWIDVGAADEPPGLEGAAHFIEHLVFKGTRSYGVGEVAAAFEALGGDVNAWTSFEETVFHATVPGEAAAQAVAILGEMVRTPRFDPLEVERERQVVVEEIRGGEDDVDLVVSEATWALAFPDHPYGRSVIGTPGTVGHMDLGALRAFHARHYLPSNSRIAVAGRFDSGRVSEAVGLHFGGGGPRPARDRRVAQHAPGKTTLLRRRFDTRLVRVAFPAPAHTHPDAVAVEVLAMAAGGGSASPLVVALRNVPGVLDATFDYEAEAQGGLLVCEAQVVAGRAGEVTRAMTRQLAALRSGELAPADTLRARLNLAVDRRARHESADGRAADACFYLAHHGAADAWRRHDAAISSTTHVEVTTVARRYLDPELAQVLALSPGLRSLRSDWSVRSPRRRVDAPEVYRLDNGIRVLVERDGSDLAAVRVAGLGGQLAERAGAEGLGAAWSRTVMRGAGGLSPDALGRAAAALGASLGASGGRSSQSMAVEGPAEHASAALELLLLGAVEPSFLATEVDRARELLVDELASRDDEPGERLSVAMWAAAFGGQPWGLDPGGTEASLARLSGASLLAAHLAWAAPENLVVGVVGNVDSECIVSRLRHVLGKLPVGRGLPRPSNLRHPRRARRVSLPSAREQAHVSAMYAGITARDRRAAALEVLGTVLSGQGGRLFGRLREESGLAYAVGASSLEGPFGGVVTCGLATDPARVHEAEAKLLAAIDGIREGDVTDGEVARARAACVGAAEAGLQTVGARCAAMVYAELYGLGGVAYRRLSRRAEPVTTADVRGVARDVFSRPTVVGRLEPRP